MKPFKTLIVALLISTGLAGVASAQPAMWTLSDEDTTINIIGTVHLLPEGTPWRSEQINKAFEAAQTVCFELDAEARALEVAGMTFRPGLGLFSGGDRLENHLTEDQATELRQLAEYYGIPFTSLNVMKPWVISIMLQEYATDQMGLGDGVEFTLYPEVRETGKTLCELETPDEQIGGFARMPLQDQIDMLFLKPEGTEDFSIEELVAYGEDEFDDLVEDWIEGDIEALDELINEEAESSEVFHKALLADRNTRWVPKIEAMLEEKSGHIFIAVGAAHLAGDDSVITMLRNKGYKIDGP